MYSRFAYLPPSIQQLVFRSLSHSQKCRQDARLNPLKSTQCTRRHAHNLSTRYKILETNVRPSSLQEVAHDLYPPSGPDGVPITDNIPSSGQETTPYSSGAGVAAITMERIELRGKSILRPKPIMVKGIPIPPRPPPPGSDDCCMSSCAICVYDLYASALEEHEEALVKARVELDKKQIPKTEWPMEVLTAEDRRTLEKQGGVDVGRRFGVIGETEKDKQMAVVIGAFVEFEKSLREKRRGEKLRDY